MLGVFVDNKCEIIKGDSELEKQIEALIKLEKEYPDNLDIHYERINCEKGLKGENEFLFQLKNSGLGMSVLHDVTMEYEGLKAQIDFIVITQGYTYFVECKNLKGDIKVNERGEFIKTYTYNNRKRSVGIESPISQAQRHIELFKKKWFEINKNNLRRLFTANERLDNWNRPLVIMSNKENILDLRQAPKDIQEKIMKSDVVIEKIKRDIKKIDKDLLSGRKFRNEQAEGFLNFYCKKMNVDYYTYYKNKFVNKSIIDKEKIEDSNNRLRECLKQFRIQKAKTRGIPFNYVFNDDELEKIINLKPKNFDELKEANILTDVKLKLHGKDIVAVVNSMVKNKKV